MKTKKSLFAIASACCALIFLFSCNLNKEKEGNWKSLLDKDLSQWRTYQSYALPDNFDYKIPADEEGNPLPPVGYDKNEKNVFSVVEADGQPVLRISGEIYGCVFTKEDFRNYHLRLKVKFGDLKWSPRLNKAKDSGILYHSQAEAGVDGWLSWMRSFEFQVMEGGTDEGNYGDLWTMAGSQIDVKASVPPGEKNHFYNPQGLLTAFGTKGVEGVCRAKDHGSPAGKWTGMELICYEGKSIYIVNGEVVMALENARYWNGTESLPMVEGKIQLQSEAAEVFYKEIEIKKINKLPAEYEQYFQ